MCCNNKRRCCKESDDCGCKDIIQARCIRVGKDYESIGVVKGDSMEVALEKMDKAFERLNNIQDGVGVDSASIGLDNRLVLVLSDGREIDAGVITIQ